MNRFILIRHAKSSWKFPNLTDHQRPLNKRGRKDGPNIASYLVYKGPFVPNYFFISTARRTQDTWSYIQKELTSHYQYQSLERLYLCHPSVIWKIVQESIFFNRVPCIIAHNPSIECIVENLMKEQDDIRITTGNIIYFENEKDHWKMVDIFRPRQPKSIF